MGKRKQVITIGFICSLIRRIIRRKVIYHPCDPETIIDDILRGIFQEEDDFYLDDDVCFNNYPRLLNQHSFVECHSEADGLHLIDTISDTKYVESIYSAAENDQPDDPHRDHLNFLTQVPESFIILGKPGLGEHVIGDLIAETYDRIHINVSRLVNNEIEKQTKIGKWIHFNINASKKIPIDLILQLVAREIQKEETQHRGYILTGFPIIPDHELSEKYTPFNIQTINMFESILEDIIQDTVEKKEDNMPSSSGSEPSETDRDKTDEDTEDVTGESVEKVEETAEEKEIKDSDSDEIPSSEESDPFEDLEKIKIRLILNAEDVKHLIKYQMRFLSRLKPFPRLLIYVTCPDDDVLSRRTSEVNLLSDLTLLIPEIPKVRRSDSAPSRKTSLGAKKFSIMISSVVEIQQFARDDEISPELADENRIIEPVTPVLYQLERYSKVFDVIQRFILYYPKENVFRIDGRYSPLVAYEALKERLERVCITKMSKAERIFPADEFNAELFEQDEDNPMEQLHIIRDYRIPEANMSWNSSLYNERCPIKMSQGKFVSGKPEFSARYRGSIVMCSSEKTLERFLSRPWRYQLPIPTCRMAIVGAPHTGKSTLARIFKILLRGVVIDAKARFGIFSDTIMYQRKEEAIVIALAEVREYRMISVQEKRELQEENIKQWMRRIQDQIEFVDNYIAKVATEEEKETYAICEKELAELGIDYNSKQSRNSLLYDPQRLMDYLPNKFKKEYEYLEPRLGDYDVQKAIYKHLKRMHIDFNMSIEDKIKNVIDRIGKIEEQFKEESNKEIRYGRWILDGPPMQMEFWDGLEEAGYLPDIVIFLNDTQGDKINEIYHRLHNINYHDTEFVMQKIFADFPELYPDKSVTVPPHSYFAKHEVIQRLLDKMLPEESKVSEDVELLMQEFNLTNAFKESLQENLKEHKKILIEIDIGAENWTESNFRAVRLYLQQFRTRPYKIKKETLTQMVVINKKLASEYYNRLHVPIYTNMGKQVQRSTIAFDFEALFELDENRKPSEEKLDRLSNGLFHFGKTYLYCPVTLRDHNLVHVGDLEYSLDYKNTLYYTASPECAEKFFVDPVYYGFSDEKVIPPPLRIFVYGIEGIDFKVQSVGEAVALNLQLDYINFIQTIKQYMSTIVNDFKYKREYREEILNDHRENLILNYLKPLFKNENGFVLVGFPFTETDMKVLIEHKCFPEFFIRLEANEEEAYQASYSLLQKEITNDQKSALAEHKKNCAQILKVWTEQRDLKYRQILRTIRFNRLQEEKRLKEAAASDGNETTTEGDEVKIADKYFEDERQASKELELIFPPPMYPPSPILTEEENEALLDEMSVKLRENIAYSISEMDDIKKLLEENRIPELVIPYKKMDVVSELRKSVYRKRLSKVQRMNMFNHVVLLSITAANKVGKNHIFPFGRFLRADPVNNRQAFPGYSISRITVQGNQFACLYKHRLYFLRGKKNLMKFISRPSEYITPNNKLYPFGTMNICVLGPMREQVSNLCNRIYLEFNTNVLSETMLRKWIIEHFGWTILGRSIAELAPDEPLTELLIGHAIILMAGAYLEGYVLDNIPMTEWLWAFLRRNNHEPNICLFVNSTFEEYGRSYFTSYHDKGGQRKLNTMFFLEQELKKYEEYMEKQLPFVKLRANMYRNSYIINDPVSDWSIWYKAYHYIKNTITSTSHYLQKMYNKEGCVSMSRACLTEFEYAYRRDYFGYYCPCCIYNNNRFIRYEYNIHHVDEEFYQKACDDFSMNFNDEVPLTLTLSTIYPDYEKEGRRVHIYSRHGFRSNFYQSKDKFYWSCDEHIIENMLSYKQILITANTCLNDLIKKAPMFVDYSPLDKVKYYGHCIVSYKHNLPANVYEKGDDKFTIYYQCKVYKFVDEKKAFKFIYDPDHYKDVKFKRQQKNKVDWDFEDMRIDFKNITNELLTNGLTEVGNNRPKHVYWDIKTSGCLFLGLWLKVNNKSNAPFKTAIYRKALDKFIKECDLFTKRLQGFKERFNPYMLDPGYIDCGCSSGTISLFKPKITHEEEADAETQENLLTTT